MAPRTVYSTRNHKVVTDKEDVQERNWINKGKVSSHNVFWLFKSIFTDAK